MFTREDYELEASSSSASTCSTSARYGHLFDGNEDQAATLLDGYLEAAGAGTGAKGG